MTLKVLLFLGSVRDGRMCSRIGNFVKNQLEKRDIKVTVFDPIDMEFPLLKKPLHFHRPDEQPPAELIERDAVIRASDAFVVICGEYNRCIPPALSNMMHHFPPASYRCKPCGIVTYSQGPGGGVAAGMQLRSFLGELGMVSPGFMFINVEVHKAYSEDGTPTPTNTVGLTKCERLINELEWYGQALKEQRDKKGLPAIPQF